MGALYHRVPGGHPASLLQRAGREAVLIDAKFSDAEAAGVPAETAAAAAR